MNTKLTPPTTPSLLQWINALLAEWLNYTYNDLRSDESVLYLLLLCVPVQQAASVLGAPELDRLRQEGLLVLVEGGSDLLVPSFGRERLASAGMRLCHHLQNHILDFQPGLIIDPVSTTGFRVSGRRYGLGSR